MRIWIINGPNLNMLGIREPSIYGTQTYADLVRFVSAVCEREGIECKVLQSNHEGMLIDWVQEAMTQADGIVINPAGYTHTSIALADALKAVSIPATEVHLSDIGNREDFRKISYTAEACLRQFMGEGFLSYEKAILFLKETLLNNQASLSAGDTGPKA